MSPFFISYMRVKERTIEIINEYIPEGHFIVSVDYDVNSAKNRLTIILDGDKGISIDVCALISRKVGYFLEEEEILDEEYNLQVSSPGADAPFTALRQYYKNVGRDVKVVTEEGERIGTLEEVDENKILLRELTKAADKGRKAKYAKETIEIGIDSILKINVIITF